MERKEKATKKHLRFKQKEKRAMWNNQLGHKTLNLGQMKWVKEILFPSLAFNGFI